MAKAYVIVGGSLAGATAAITLREEGADGSVTLIGAEREPPYERPPLSKAYLRGEVPFDKVARASGCVLRRTWHRDDVRSPRDPHRSVSAVR